MSIEEKDKKHIKVTIVWGGTGASKELNVERSDTAGSAFNEIYKKFGQTPSSEDTFELNGVEYPRADFDRKIEELIHRHGAHLTFEVIPPTSGA